MCAAMPAAMPVLDRLRDRTLAVVAEVKRGSPSAGMFAASLDAATQAAMYADAGAAAVSVLTDGPYFGGSLDDLRAVRNAIDVPVLQKDFIVDPYQLLEARAAGADIVLLIVAALAPERLGALLSATRALGMTALVEVHTSLEAAEAARIDARLVGINNRDLHSFDVDLGTTGRIRPLLPAASVAIALSGIKSVGDAQLMRAAGADAVLVGEALVRAQDPGLLIQALRNVA